MNYPALLVGFGTVLFPKKVSFIHDDPIGVISNLVAGLVAIF